MSIRSLLDTLRSPVPKLFCCVDEPYQSSQSTYRLLVSLMSPTCPKSIPYSTTSCPDNLSFVMSKLLTKWSLRLALRFRQVAPTHLLIISFCCWHLASAYRKNWVAWNSKGITSVSIFVLWLLTVTHAAKISTWTATTILLPIKIVVFLTDIECPLMKWADVWLNPVVVWIATSLITHPLYPHYTSINSLFEIKRDLLIGLWGQYFVGNSSQFFNVVFEDYSLCLKFVFTLGKAWLHLYLN